MVKAKKRKAKRALSPYNRHVQREMKAGKSMKQAAASWKRGGKKSTSTSRLRRKVSSGRKRSVSRRAPKKVGKKVGRGGFSQQKLFKLARMAAMLGPHAGVWMSAGTPAEKASASVRLLSGFDMNTGQFDIQNLVQGYGPLLATTVVTKVIPKISGLLGGLM